MSNENYTLIPAKIELTAMYPAHTLLPFGTDYGKSPAHIRKQSSDLSLSFCSTPTTC